MSADKPLCSIVIRAFNEEDHIEKLLVGIQQQTYPNKEIILVDSGSTDRTLEITNRFPVKVLTIDSSEFTFGRSLNRGIEASLGELIVIISAHCYPVFPDWLGLLVEPFKDQRIAISYGKQRGAESNRYSEHQFFRTYFPEVSQPAQGQPFTHNANAAVRKSLWKQHPYNEDLTGLEDLEWSSWAQDQGYGIAYVAEAEIIHVHDESFKQIRNRYKREAIAMKQILPDSQFTIKNMLGMIIQSIANDLYQAYKERVLAREILSVIRYRLMQYLGTWEGYQYSGKIDQKLHQRFYYPPGLLTDKIPESRTVQPIKYQTDYGEERKSK